MDSRKALPAWMQQWWLWFALILTVTFLAFWPSFFSAIVRVDASIIVHGISATAWMLLTVVQAWVIKARLRKIHHSLGYGSLALAIILVLSGLQMLRQMVLREGTAAIGIPMLGMKFFYIDITGLALFSLFLGLAIRAARNRDIGLHLRLMACTAIIPLEAALERVFLYATPTWVLDSDVALFASNWALIGLTAALAIMEWRYGRLRWPFPVMLAYYMFAMLTIEPVANAQWFQSFAFAVAGR